MAKLQCSCGYIINISNDNDYEFYLVKLTDILDISEKLDNKEMDGDQFFSLIQEEGNKIISCDKCGMLYRYSYDLKKKKEKVIVYKVERQSEHDIQVDIVYDEEE